MALGEFELIAKYFSAIGPLDPQRIPLAVGDDCALLNPPSGQQLAISVDTLVADVHFPAAGNPALIAQKALRCNLSDLAAMGAQPLAFTLALTLPAADENWLAPFSQGLRACADEFGIALIGGDTTRGQQLVITIQVLGLVPTGAALTRSGAQAGDAIFVSGTLGDAHAALDLLSIPAAQLNSQQQFLLARYYTPSPRIALGIALRQIASAAIDISDGLTADLGHILERSNAGAMIDLEKLPLSNALRGAEQARQFAMSGGDDYELCFTVPPEKIETVLSIAKTLGIALTNIGEIKKEKGLLERDADGNTAPLNATGYQHF